MNIKLIEDRLGFIIKSLAKLKELSTFTKKEFLKNDKPSVAESYLRKALEAVFDIAGHKFKYSFH